MNSYWELREIVKRIIPRRLKLAKLEKHFGLVKEKGRKSNYHQLDLKTGEMKRIERLLNKEEIKSFLEVSLRSAHCPMPFNADVWDAMLCVVGGQKVKTSKGNKYINKIKVGNKIASFNEQTNEIEYKRVEQVKSSNKEDIYEIETETGKIKITSDHPIFTKRGWILAKNLMKEDEILEME